MNQRIPSLAAAALLLAAAGCSNEDDDKDATDAGAPASSSAAAEPTNDPAIEDEETLAPGVPAYDEFVLSTGATVRVDVAAPAEGWFVHLGDPQRGLNVGPESAWTGLLWYETTGVFQDQCGDDDRSAEAATPMTDSLRPLVTMPYLRKVVQDPARATLGGRVAEHAVLVLKGCGAKEDHTNPLATAGASGPLPGDRPFDIWLVPLPEADTAMVVFDPTGDGSAEVRGQWQQVVDSLRITVTPGG
ncbi:hypothetical protein CFH99_21120 [Nocardioides aromaticivorans]|uniref:Secreted protein n=1 Tax=Nocardioides aromaticivorans TaxID=200618 RepID=A0ABX7PQF8_9ACTN|nr:hypothetical protein [Nocardioides aromaticivorans]QSR28126.1 hypothetical protein CFH99_21120 [Nocardioides aromaticivorans]